MESGTHFFKALSITLLALIGKAAVCADCQRTLFWQPFKAKIKRLCISPAYSWDDVATIHKKATMPGHDSCTLDAAARPLA